jgi:hypothetical protein
MLFAMPPSSEVMGAIGHLLQPLLEVLERVGWVQRHLFPPVAARLAEQLAPGAEAVAGPLSALEKLEWPDDLGFMRERLIDVSRQTVDLVTAFVDAARSPDNPIDLYRALRRFARIQEALYPLAPVFEPVSRWFLEPARRDDDRWSRACGTARSATTRCAWACCTPPTSATHEAASRSTSRSIRTGVRCRWSSRCTEATATGAIFSGAGWPTRARTACS